MAAVQGDRGDATGVFESVCSVFEVGLDSLSAVRSCWVPAGATSSEPSGDQSRRLKKEGS